MNPCRKKTLWVVDLGKDPLVRVVNYSSLSGTTKKHIFFFCDGKKLPGKVFMGAKQG